MGDWQSVGVGHEGNKEENHGLNVYIILVPLQRMAWGRCAYPIKISLTDPIVSIRTWEMARLSGSTQSDIRKSLKAILHYALGLRFGNLKHSKTREKTQLTRVFTQRIVKSHILLVMFYLI